MTTTMDISTLFSVRNKNVLVTGGAKGIGLMISTGFVANGANVWISSRDAASCKKVAAELSSKGPGKAFAIPADLQSLDACKSLVSTLEQQLPGGALHVLVNNSGANWGESISTYPDSAWDKVLNLNLKRVFTLTQLCLPLLEKASSSSPSSSSGSPSVGGGGEGGDSGARIIHIGSIDALRISTLETYAYAASKAGLHHLSRMFAANLGKRRITSNVLACGPFRSKMMAATLERFGDVIEAGVPLGRIGAPEDVAGACLFLASRAGAYVNGATITVDGGSAVASKL